MTFFLQEHEYTQGYERAFAKYFASEEIEDKQLIAKNVMVMPFSEVMQQIYEHNPEIHLVVLLREPVARAYSAYWWARRRGWENIKTYEEALATEKARLNEDRFKWRQCVYQYNSIYYPHVKNLIDQFGRSRVHCFLTDDLKENAEGICQQLFNHIGIRDDFKPSIGKRHNQATMPRSERFNFLFTQFLASHNPLRKAIRKLVPDAAAYKLRKAVLDWNERPQQEQDWTPPTLNPETRERQMAYFKPFKRTIS